MEGESAWPFLGDRKFRVAYARENSVSIPFLLTLDVIEIENSREWEGATIALQFVGLMLLYKLLPAILQGPFKDIVLPSLNLLSDNLLLVVKGPFVFPVLQLYTRVFFEFESAVLWGTLTVSFYGLIVWSLYTFLETVFDYLSTMYWSECVGFIKAFFLLGICLYTSLKWLGFESSSNNDGWEPSNEICSGSSRKGSEDGGLDKGYDPCEGGEDPNETGNGTNRPTKNKSGKGEAAEKTGKNTRSRTKSSDQSSKTIVLTGGSGGVGRHLYAYLRSRGHTVHLVLRPLASQHELRDSERANLHAKSIFNPCDLEFDEISFKDEIPNTKIDYVIHLAQVNGPAARRIGGCINEHTLLHRESRMLDTTLKFVRKHKIPNFIFTSSWSVLFDHCKSTNRHDPTFAKRICETFVLRFGLVTCGAKAKDATTSQGGKINPQSNGATNANGQGNTASKANMPSNTNLFSRHASSDGDINLCAEVIDDEVDGLPKSDGFRFQFGNKNLFGNKGNQPKNGPDDGMNGTDDGMNTKINRLLFQCACCDPTDDKMFSSLFQDSSSISSGGNGESNGTSNGGKGDPATNLSPVNVHIIRPSFVRGLGLSWTKQLEQILPFVSILPADFRTHSVDISQLNREFLNIIEGTPGQSIFTSVLGEMQSIRDHRAEKRTVFGSYKALLPTLILLPFLASRVNIMMNESDALGDSYQGWQKQLFESPVVRLRDIMMLVGNFCFNLHWGTFFKLAPYLLGLTKPLRGDLLSAIDGLLPNRVESENVEIRVAMDVNMAGMDYHGDHDSVAGMVGREVLTEAALKGHVIDNNVEDQTAGSTGSLYSRNAMNDGSPSINRASSGGTLSAGGPHLADDKSELGTVNIMITLKFLFVLGFFFYMLRLVCGWAWNSFLPIRLAGLFEYMQRFVVGSSNDFHGRNVGNSSESTSELVHLVSGNRRNRSKSTARVTAEIVHLQREMDSAQTDFLLCPRSEEDIISVLQDNTMRDIDFNTNVSFHRFNHVYGLAQYETKPIAGPQTNGASIGGIQGKMNKRGGTSSTNGGSTTTKSENGSRDDHGTNDCTIVTTIRACAGAKIRQLIRYCEKKSTKDQKLLFPVNDRGDLNMQIYTNVGDALATIVDARYIQNAVVEKDGKHNAVGEKDEMGKKNEEELDGDKARGLSKSAGLSSHDPVWDTELMKPDVKPTLAMDDGDDLYHNATFLLDHVKVMRYFDHEKSQVFELHDPTIKVPSSAAPPLTEWNELKRYFMQESMSFKGYRQTSKGSCPSIGSQGSSFLRIRRKYTILELEFEVFSRRSDEVREKDTMIADMFQIFLLTPRVFFGFRLCANFEWYFSDTDAFDEFLDELSNKNQYQACILAIKDFIPIPTYFRHRLVSVDIIVPNIPLYIRRCAALYKKYPVRQNKRKLVF